MAFVRTVVIIAVLLLGWAAIRAESSAHVVPVTVSTHVMAD